MVDFILLTPTLSSRRGSLIILQPIVFCCAKKFFRWLCPEGKGAYILKSPVLPSLHNPLQSESVNLWQFIYRCVNRLFLQQIA